MNFPNNRASKLFFGFSLFMGFAIGFIPMGFFIKHFIDSWPHGMNPIEWLFEFAGSGALLAAGCFLGGLIGFGVADKCCHKINDSKIYTYDLPALSVKSTPAAEQRRDETAILITANSADYGARNTNWSPTRFSQNVQLAQQLFNDELQTLEHESSDESLSSSS